MSVTRRDVAQQDTAGLTFALTLQADPRALVGGAAAADGGVPRISGSRLGTDGTDLKIVSPAAELGQGTFTRPAVLADELDADWAKGEKLSGRVEREEVRRSGLGRRFQHDGVAGDAQAIFTPMRVGGAQARRVLLDMVAAKWKRACWRAFGPSRVSCAEEASRPGAVGYRRDRKLSPRFRLSCPRSRRKTSEPATNFRYIGKDLPRVDVPSKVTGAANLRHRCAGARHGLCRGAAIAYEGGTPATVDTRKGGGGRHRRDPSAGRRCRGRQFGEATQAARTASRSPGAMRRPHVAIRNARSRTSPPSRRKSRPMRSPRSATSRRRWARPRGLPWRISHPLHLSRPDGADERDRHGRAGWQAAEIWVGTQNPTGCTTTSRASSAPTAARSRPPARGGRRLWPARRSAGRVSSGRLSKTLGSGSR